MEQSLYFKNDIISAILVSTNIPYAVLGGYLGLLFRGMHFSISAGVGFVSLLGISVMSGVLLVDYLNIQVKERNESKDKIWNISIFLELVKEGSRVQFRPRFLVMLIAILGLIPATLNTGVGSDVQRPLATVIVGGLFSSLILGIYLSPISYFLANQKRFISERK
jgi:cobalt-zinc-cadmium resistance protein CzcA